MNNQDALDTIAAGIALLQTQLVAMQTAYNILLSGYKSDAGQIAALQLTSKQATNQATPVSG